MRLVQFHFRLSSNSPPLSPPPLPDPPFFTQKKERVITLPDSRPNQLIPNMSTAKGVVYGLHAFLAENEDEISFAPGEEVVVLEKDDQYGDGWWQVSSCS